jgi:hypothetical protein
MRRLAVVLVAGITLTTSGSAWASPGSPVARGGGRGTIDGVTPFSQFGFTVRFDEAGAATGSFNCLMAGSSVFPGFEPLMKVSGSVTGGSVDAAAGTASFTGSGTLNLGPNGRMEALFVVSVSEGGPGVGKLRLTVLAPSFPVPQETVLTGRISIQ